ncbi:DUF317 domain-containing protein [Streptomyces chartreusis]
MASDRSKRAARILRARRRGEEPPRPASAAIPAPPPLAPDPPLSDQYLTYTGSGWIASDPIADSGHRAEGPDSAGQAPTSQYAHDERVMVSPRYMAGTGDQIADVIGPLIHLFGWPTQHDAATGHFKIDSPDGSMFCEFDPIHPLSRWWTISHHEPYWEATFSRQMPMEAIAAVTQALPQLLGDNRQAERIPITDMPLDQLADLNDWSVEGGTLTSPDRYCRLVYTPHEEIAWQVEHVNFENAALATFTKDTPTGLVRNLFAHLAMPTPVERTFADVPISTRYGHGAVITPGRGAAVNPHVHHALGQLERHSF